MGRRALLGSVSGSFLYFWSLIDIRENDDHTLPVGAIFKSVMLGDFLTVVNDFYVFPQIGWESSWRLVDQENAKNLFFLICIKNFQINLKRQVKLRFSLIVNTPNGF